MPSLNLAGSKDGMMEKSHHVLFAAQIQFFFSSLFSFCIRVMLVQIVCANVMFPLFPFHAFFFLLRYSALVVWRRCGKMDEKSPENLHSNVLPNENVLWMCDYIHIFYFVVVVVVGGVVVLSSFLHRFFFQLGLNISEPNK